MTNNAPQFDPLNATPEQKADMLAGYLAADGSELKPGITSAAYDHGWRVRRNDMAGVADDDQRELARRLLRRNDINADHVAPLQRDTAPFRRRQPGLA